METKFIITIGRQFGSGGKQIGEKLAQAFNIDFYDKELIRIASQESGLVRELFEKVDEMTSYSLLSSFHLLQGQTASDNYFNTYLSNEKLFAIQSDVIRKLAAEKSSIFIGRCADYILKDYPRCLSVFITADHEDRVKRIVDSQKVTEKKAAEVIDKIDKKRANYYNYYTSKTWGAAASYQLCINSSVLGIEKTTKFIEQYATELFMLGK